MAAPTNSTLISLDDAYGWLNQFEESRLRPASRQLLAIMKSSIDAQKFQAGWAAQKELIIAIEQPSFEHDGTEILIHCGWAAFKMNNNAEAISLLQNAFCRAATHKHLRAVAGWMLGHVLWLQPYPNMHDAIHAWEGSIENFDHLARQRTLSSTTVKWYKQNWERMEQCLRQFIEVNARQPTASSGDSRHSDPPPAPTPIPNSPFPSTGPSVPKQKRHRIQSFRVLGTIPAGTPASVAEPSGTVTLEELILDEKRYRIISLKWGEYMINLPSGSEYYVLHVAGNSMNATAPEPIQNGDYVLMRAQATAENGDIVAAEIVGLDDRATLKRYKVENGKIILKPESNDPDYHDPIYAQNEFTRLDDHFYIRGIALAVLKRVED